MLRSLPRRRPSGRRGRLRGRITPSRRNVRPDRETPPQRPASLSRSLPPVLVLSWTFVAGLTSRHLGFPPVLLPTLLLLPFLPWLRPCTRWRLGLLAILLLAGWLHADAWGRDRDRDCRLALGDGSVHQVTGRVSGSWRRGYLLDVARGLPEACRTTLYVAPARGDESPGPGSVVRVRGRWRSWPSEGDPERAGELSLDEPASVAEGEEGVPRGLPLHRWREGVADRVASLFPRRTALVSALVLARKGELDPELREAFTRAGVAHLLAISGFHVGVLAVVVLGLLRTGGAGRRMAAVAGAAVVWSYVLFIGAPDAAVRAGILLSLGGIGILRGRPIHGAGALSAGLLAFALVDPGAVLRVGFQLSFLGAGGLVLLGPVVDRGLVRHLRWTGTPGLRSGVCAGLAATLATLPAVAWHFDRVSLVGIPVTLVATPLVAVALPGLLGALLLEPLSAGGAAFVAGGADLLLAVLVRVVEIAAAPDFAVFHVPRSWLLAGAVGVAATIAVAPRQGVGPEVRMALTTAGAVAAVLVTPAMDRLAGSGSLEIALLDVGQGDAVAIRSPRGRWILVDAGPGPPRGGADPTPAALVELRRRGVRRLDLLVLSHPDMDHVGGAAAVVEALAPPVVAGPGHVRGTVPYVSALKAAAGAGRARASWVALREGDRIELDGMQLRVLYPPTPLDRARDPNDNSVVLILQFGDFTAFLGGDAPRSVEDALVAEVGDVDLLKVSHHGSRTSTSRAFLERVRPEVALLSLGRRNRYGHPHPEVLERLEQAAQEIYRTDRQGTVRLRVGRDGRWSEVGSW